MRTRVYDCTLGLVNGLQCSAVHIYKRIIFNIYLFIDTIKYSIVSIVHSVHCTSSAHTIGVLNCDIVLGGGGAAIVHYEAAEMRTHSLDTCKHNHGEGPY